MSDLHLPKRGFAGWLAESFITSKLTPLFILASLLLGLFAVRYLPREEEPQIHVPFFDVFVPFPGAGSEEVEKRIIEVGERRLWEIPGVEYVYSTAMPNYGMFTVRFKVGSNPEDSLIKLYTKVYANLDSLPAGAGQPLIKPRSIDDVPVLALTFWRKDGDPVELRRVAARVQQEINGLENISETTLIGGRRRTFRIFFDPVRLARVHLTPLELEQKIRAFNSRLPAGHLDSDRGAVPVETDSLVRDIEDLRSIVVGVDRGAPVRLGDVAEVGDGPDEGESSVTLASRGIGGREAPAVTLAVSKRPGSNAAFVVRRALEKVESLKGGVIPPEVSVTVTRNYGRTAEEKSNELLFHMLLATLSVVALIGLALGAREAAVVGLAVPVTLALTLLIFFLHGYTLNRITLFALIFSIGILVDDAIVVVENIVRHLAMPREEHHTVRNIIVRAVSEVGNPTALATWTVIAAILPMAFVSGLMGPYMRPIPVGASAAMLFSLVVAFIVTPWAGLKILRHAPHPHGAKEGFFTALYRKGMTPIIRSGGLRTLFLAGMVVLLIAAVALVPLKAVVVKMLPFDNKSEFQVIVNLPEGSDLGRTRAAAGEIRALLEKLPEARDIETYVGAAAPYNFNGLVRHYFLRDKPNQADIQVNLVGKNKRKRSSHEIARSVRGPVHDIVRKYGGRVQVAEVPPGPPVLSTIVLEVYGPEPEGRLRLARQLRGLLEDSPGVTDVDFYYEEEHSLERLKVDRLKASLNGIPAEAVAQTVSLGLEGRALGLAHPPDEPEPVELWMRLPERLRRTTDGVRSVAFLSRAGSLIPVRDLTKVETVPADQPLYHKNLNPVMYVVADVAGRLESPVYALLDLKDKIARMPAPDGTAIEQDFRRAPDSGARYAVVWDGEWRITYEVFRDLGIAFAAVLVLIYILVVAWFQSFAVPFVIMAPIPLTLVGILPAHALLGAYFTATSMIGFIAGAGIIVRNSIILVDFIELRLQQGMALEDAVVDAGAVRFRPMLLTAAAVMVGASVILFDPIFQGLALSLMAGEVASTLLSRMAVPVLYYLLKKRVR